MELSVSSNDSYVDVIDGYASFNSIDDGDVDEAIFSFSISNNAPDGYTFSLDLNMSSDENDWDTSLNLALEALVESFESGSFSDLDWDLSANAYWSIDSEEYYEGGYSARSATIGDNTVSTIELTMDILEAGSISFHILVSS